MDKLITLKYLFAMKDTPEQSICVKYHTCTQKEHDDLIQQIKDSDDIVSCCTEYISEIEPTKIGIFTTVKRREVDDNA